MRYTNTTLPPWFDYLELAVNYSCMTYMAITLPLYIAVVTIMIILRKRSYKGQFIFIWFLDFYMSQGTTVGHIYLIIAWTTRCSQGCTVTLLALNRATAVCSPIRHKQLVSRLYMVTKYTCWHIYLIIALGYSL
ncbi:hypothetical protein OSTOST_01466 [Ostertagia ostertagi]